MRRILEIIVAPAPTSLRSLVMMVSAPPLSRSTQSLPEESIDLRVREKPWMLGLFVRSVGKEN
jgi:hypothetical protein